MIQFGSRKDLKTVLGNKNIFGKDDCPFCRDIKINERVLWKGIYWAVIYNKFPYILEGKHLMLVPVKHSCFSSEIQPEEYSEIGQAHQFLAEYFKGEPYFSFTRESIEERSVEHLHIHFISGKVKRRVIVDMLKNQGFISMEED